MDYKALLQKYIRHVGEEEGVTFIEDRKPEYATEEEWAELERLDEIDSVQRWLNDAKEAYKRADIDRAAANLKARIEGYEDRLKALKKDGE